MKFMISIVGGSTQSQAQTLPPYPKAWVRSTQKAFPNRCWKIHKARARVATGFGFHCVLRENFLHAMLVAILTIGACRIVAARVMTPLSNGIFDSGVDSGPPFQDTSARENGFPCGVNMSNEMQT